VSFRRIPIAVDEQPVSVRAAEVGAELARSLGGGVALIHVNDPHLPRRYGNSSEGIDRSSRRRQQEIAGGFPSAPFAATFDTRVRAAWRARCGMARRPHCRRSHGHTGVRRAMLGSVAEGVMRNAPCPVLVVRAQT
jgi:nucleotide-binding universal stress UspA family protein